MTAISFSIEVSDIEIKCLVSPWNIRVEIAMRLNDIRQEIKPFDYSVFKWSELKENLLDYGFSEQVLKVFPGLGGEYLYKLPNLENFKRRSASNES